MPDLPPHLQSIVDTICESGCGNVNDLIRDIEQGEQVSTLEGLTEEESSQILAELRSIMQVYEN